MSNDTRPIELREAKLDRIAGGRGSSPEASIVARPRHQGATAPDETGADTAAVATEQGLGFQRNNLG